MISSRDAILALPLVGRVRLRAPGAGPLDREFAGRRKGPFMRFGPGLRSQGRGDFFLRGVTLSRIRTARSVLVRAGFVA